MVKDVLDRLITMSAQLHTFSVCRIQCGWRLLFDPFEAVTVHYVLAASSYSPRSTTRNLYGP